MLLDLEILFIQPFEFKYIKIGSCFLTVSRSFITEKQNFQINFEPYKKLSTSDLSTYRCVMAAREKNVIRGEEMLLAPAQFSFGYFLCLDVMVLILSTVYKDLTQFTIRFLSLKLFQFMYYQILTK